MGRSLFTLEDNFVESMCFGASDKETRSTLVGALEAGRQSMQEALHERLRSSPWKDRVDEFLVRLERGQFVVVPPADLETEVLTSEYGDLDSPPRPLLRQAVVQGRTSAQRAITKALDLQ